MRSPECTQKTEEKFRKSSHNSAIAQAQLETTLPKERSAFEPSEDRPFCARWSLCELMGLYVNHWESMGVYGSLWEPFGSHKTYGSKWESLEAHRPMFRKFGRPVRGNVRRALPHSDTQSLCELLCYNRCITVYRPRVNVFRSPYSAFLQCAGPVGLLRCLARCLTTGDPETFEQF